MFIARYVDLSNPLVVELPVHVPLQPVIDKQAAVHYTLCVLPVFVQRTFVMHVNADGYLSQPGVLLSQLTHTAYRLMPFMRSFFMLNSSVSEQSDHCYRGSIDMYRDPHDATNPHVYPYAYILTI